MTDSSIERWVLETRVGPEAADVLAPTLAAAVEDVSRIVKALSGEEPTLPTHTELAHSLAIPLINALHIGDSLGQTLSSREESIEV